MKIRTNWQSKPESTFGLGIDFVLWCHTHLGKHFSHTIIRFIALTVWMLNPSVRKVSKQYLDNLKQFAAVNNISLPHLSTLKHINRFCNNFLDQLLSWQNKLDMRDVIPVDNSHERFVIQTTKNTGSVIISAHIGNIEMMRAINNHLQIKNKLNIIIWMNNNKRFMKYLKKLDPNSNINLIPSNNIDPSTIFTLDDKIKKGEVIVILADRITGSESKTVEVEFLGKQAFLPQGPWILAGILNAPVFTSYNIYSDGRYHSYLNEWGPIKLRDRKNREEEIKQLASRFIQELEEMVIKSPYDWFNFYNFWQEPVNSQKQK